MVCFVDGEEKVTTAVQRAFRTQFDKALRSRLSMYVWCKPFGQERCIYEGKCPGVPFVSGATLYRVRAYSQSSPQKSIRLGGSV
jgi:hypothetical protein